MAAAAAGVFLLWTGLARSGSSPVEAWRFVDARAVVSSDDWDTRPWGVVRGPEPSDRERASFRAGLLWTQLNIAMEAQDREAALALVAGIQQLVRPLSLSAGAMERLRTLATLLAADGPVAELRSTETVLCGTLDCSTFRAAESVEAVRLWALFDRSTARRRDVLASLQRLRAAGFESSVLTAALDHLEAQPPRYDAGVTILHELIEDRAR